MKAALWTRLIGGAALFCLVAAGCGTTDTTDITVTPEFEPIPNVGVTPANNPFLGTYDVTITGTVDATANQSFAQPAIVTVEQLPSPYGGNNSVVFNVSTRVIPSAAGNSLGAMQISSAGLQGGIPTDAFSVTFNVNEIRIQGGTPGVPLAGGSAVFRPAPGMANGAVVAATVRSILVLNGTALSGTIEMTDVSGLIRYRAQIIGTKRS